MPTPKIEVTPKGFKILSVDIDQCLHWGGLGICDFCGQTQTLKGKYIAVMNQYVCIPCFEDWHKTATNYTEDAAIEEKNVYRMLERISQ